MQVNKKWWILLKWRRSTTIIKAEMTCFEKKAFTMKKSVLFFFIKFLVNNCLHVLKLALNKRMHASDNEQGINKLWPKSKNPTPIFTNRTSFSPESFRWIQWNHEILKNFKKIIESSASLTWRSIKYCNVTFFIINSNFT